MPRFHDMFSGGSPDLDGYRAQKRKIDPLRGTEEGRSKYGRQSYVSRYVCVFVRTWSVAGLIQVPGTGRRVPGTGHQLLRKSLRRGGGFFFFRLFCYKRLFMFGAWYKREKIPCKTYAQSVDFRKLHFLLFWRSANQSNIFRKISLLLAGMSARNSK